jgi:hypothetical protein
MELSNLKHEGALVLVVLLVMNLSQATDSARVFTIVTKRTFVSISYCPLAKHNAVQRADLCAVTLKWTNGPPGMEVTSVSTRLAGVFSVQRIS